VGTAGYAYYARFDFGITGCLRIAVVEMISVSADTGPGPANRPDAASLIGTTEETFVADILTGKAVRQARQGGACGEQDEAKNKGIERSSVQNPQRQKHFCGDLASALHSLTPVCTSTIVPKSALGFNNNILKLTDSVVKLWHSHFFDTDLHRLTLFPGTWIPAFAGMTDTLILLSQQ
jgi:hypothetical protein